MVKEYDGKVRVVYKHFVVHPDTAMDAHLANCAAGKQGKFNEFMATFWDKGFNVYKETRDPKALGKESIMKMAADLGLDQNKLESDMQGEECKQRVQADMAELNKFGVRATPSFFVNGKFIMFSTPAAFKSAIDAELKDVEASGVPAGQYYQKVVMEKGEKTFKSRGGAG